MSKGQTVTKNTNIFSMQSLSSDCYYPSVVIDFTAPINPTKPSLSIAPIFLKDRKSFTPAFVLPNDQTYYTTNCAYEKAKFQERVLKALQLEEDLQKEGKQIQELPLATPSSTFCQICKLTFSCYEEHIKSNDHIFRLQERVGNKYIDEVCDLVKGRLGALQKRKTIKKERKKNVGKEIHEAMETRSKKKFLRDQKVGITSKVINLSINTLCSFGNNY